jgi:plasmid stabilization system protein ParE
MKSARWSPAAVEDLNGLRDYFAEDVTTAQLIIDRLVLATDWLLDWPYAGQEIAQSGWRKWPPRQTGYVLIYRPTADGIEVGYVRHERENWLADW